jgi:hypothetical protein
MNLLCPVTISEDREIDAFDLIAVLGLMKEYNRQEIWRRYGPEGVETDSISMYVQQDDYFLEMHIQTMQRIILSEKFNTNPFVMQQVVQRITACHDHSLIVEKIRAQGIDTGDNPICLACSMGNTIIDLIVNKNDGHCSRDMHPRGNTHIEMVEQRPLDVYDISSTLYLCQQNQTSAIFRRYRDLTNGSGGTDETPEVNMSCRVGDYMVLVHFHCLSGYNRTHVPPVRNASVFTMHQVLQRMNFRHRDELILVELQEVGLPITLDQVRTEFSLQRYINNTALRLTFTRT